MKVRRRKQSRTPQRQDLNFSPVKWWASFSIVSISAPMHWYEHFLDLDQFCLNNFDLKFWYAFIIIRILLSDFVSNLKYLEEITFLKIKISFIFHCSIYTEERYSILYPLDAMFYCLIHQIILACIAQMKWKSLLGHKKWFSWSQEKYIL